MNANAVPINENDLTFPPQLYLIVVKYTEHKICELNRFLTGQFRGAKYIHLVMMIGLLKSRKA